MVTPLVPHELLGSTLRSVTAAWHVFRGKRGGGPVHVWFHLDPVGAVKVHTPGRGGIELSVEAPYDAYDMADSGAVVVERAEGALGVSDLVGKRLQEVETVVGPDGDEVGVVFRFGSRELAVIENGDEILVVPWPDNGWAERGYAVR